MLKLRVKTKTTLPGVEVRISRTDDLKGLEFELNGEGSIFWVFFYLQPSIVDFCSRFRLSPEQSSVSSSLYKIIYFVQPLSSGGNRETKISHKI